MRRVSASRCARWRRVASSRRYVDLTNKRTHTHICTQREAHRHTYGQARWYKSLRNNKSEGIGHNTELPPLSMLWNAPSSPSSASLHPGLGPFSSLYLLLFLFLLLWMIWEHARRKHVSISLDDDRTWLWLGGRVWKKVPVLHPKWRVCVIFQANIRRRIFPRLIFRETLNNEYLWI